MIVELLKKLIAKKYYKEKSEIENKLNVFYAMSKITDEEYSKVIELGLVGVRTELSFKRINNYNILYIIH